MKKTTKKDLKEMLFDMTASAMEKIMAWETLFGPDAEETRRARVVWYPMFTLILDAGLEEEYADWCVKNHRQEG